MLVDILEGLRHAILTLHNTLTIHISRNNRAPAHSCNHLVVLQSYSSIKSCRYSSRASVDVHIRHQNGQNRISVTVALLLSWFENLRNC